MSSVDHPDRTDYDSQKWKDSHFIFCESRGSTVAQVGSKMENEVVTNMNIGLVIISSLLSGLIGVLVSMFFYQRYERRKVKFDTARRLFGYRFSITGEGFSNAMNEVFVVFADAPKVIKAMEDLYNELSTPGKHLAEDKLVSFFKEICKELNIDYTIVNESFFIKTFNARN